MPAASSTPDPRTARAAVVAGVLVAAVVFVATLLWATLTGNAEPETVGAEWLSRAPARFGRAMLQIVGAPRG
ncbi:MAG TPA: hypothetical protein VGO23_02350 [Pseudonocardia sp.]|nr:hypothetical protein [Pseudonocardia sp.]